MVVGAPPNDELGVSSSNGLSEANARSFQVPEVKDTTHSVINARWRRFGKASGGAIAAQAIKRDTKTLIYSSLAAESMAAVLKRDAAGENRPFALLKMGDLSATFNHQTHTWRIALISNTMSSGAN